jgi:hypothetical protein
MMTTLRRVFYLVIGCALFIAAMLVCFAIGSWRVGGY